MSKKFHIFGTALFLGMFSVYGYASSSTSPSPDDTVHPEDNVSVSITDDNPHPEDKNAGTEDNSTRRTTWASAHPMTALEVVRSAWAAP